jgi:hypothetical protein
MIEKKQIFIPYQRVIKEAHYQEIETGKFKEVSIFDEQGNEKKELRPIYNKVFIEAVKEDALEEKTIWAVKNGDEEHHFATEKEARDFIQ